MKLVGMILLVIGVFVGWPGFTAPACAGALRDGVTDDDGPCVGGPDDDAFLADLPLRDIAFICYNVPAEEFKRRFEAGEFDR